MSEAVKTIDPPSRVMSDPRATNKMQSPTSLERTFSERRDVLSTSPLGMQTMDVSDNKSFLRPIIPV